MPLSVSCLPSLAWFRFGWGWTLPTAFPGDVPCSGPALVLADFPWEGWTFRTVWQHQVHRRLHPWHPSWSCRTCCRQACLLDILLGYQWQPRSTRCGPGSLPDPHRETSQQTKEALLVLRPNWLWARWRHHTYAWTILGLLEWELHLMTLIPMVNWISFFLGELPLSEVLLYSLILFSLRVSTLRLGVLDLSLTLLDAAPGPDFNTTAGGLAADFFATLALVLPLSDALPPLLLCELRGWAGSGGSHFPCLVWADQRLLLRGLVHRPFSQFSVCHLCTS